MYYSRFILLSHLILYFYFFFFNDTATTEIYTLSTRRSSDLRADTTELYIKGPQTRRIQRETIARLRSEEHTSELQSQSKLVCRLLLEKKNIRLSSEIPLAVIMKKEVACAVAGVLAARPMVCRMGVTSALGPLGR